MTLIGIDTTKLIAILSVTEEVKKSSGSINSSTDSVGDK